CFIDLSFQFVGISLTLCRFLKVYTSWIPRRDLHPGKSERFCPFTNADYIVEWSGIAHELCEENARAFQCFHWLFIYDLSNRMFRPFFLRLGRCYNIVDECHTANSVFHSGEVQVLRLRLFAIDLS